jgi:hypothetical protein
MQRCAGAQTIRDLAPIDFRNLTVPIKDRNDQRAVEVLVPALAIDSRA